MHYLEKELNDLIRQDSQIFQFLQDAALDGLWYWDLENPQAEWMNPRFWEVLGYDPNLQPHSPEAWKDIIDKEDLKQAEALIGGHLADPKVAYDQVVRYHHKEGRLVWIRCRGLAIRDEQGRPLRMIGAHQDVSKEKEAELRAKRLSRRFRSMLDAQGVFVIRLDADGAYTFANAHFKKIFGTKTFFTNSFLPLQMQSWQEAVKSAFENPNERQTVELRQDTFKGEGRIIRWDLVALENPDTQEQELQGVGIDFTEVRATQKELERTKDLLTRASRGARIGAWEVNLEDNTTIWSEVTKEIHEVPADYQSRVEDGLSFYKAGKHQARITELFQRLVEEHRPFEEDFIIITAKGREVWVRVIGQAIVENGVCKRVYGTFQDIDSEKRNALEKERWRQAVEQNQDGIYAFNASDLKLVYANQQAQEQTQKTLSALQGLPIFDFTGNYPKEKIHEILRRLMLGEQGQFSFESTVLDHVNQPYFAELQLQWVKDPEMNLYLLTSRDISARKAAEERQHLLQSVVEQAQDSMVIAETQPQLDSPLLLNVLYINPAFEQLTGYSLSTMQEKGLRILGGAQTAQLSIQRLNKHLENWEAVDLELIIYRADETPVWVQLSGKPIFNERGSLRYWIGILRDISNQKAYERLLLQNRKRAEAANEAKSAFLANMSHEIRTPLNGVIGFTDLLKRTSLDVLQKQYLQTVERSAHTLLEVINDILDFSKIEAGKLELESQRVDLLLLLEETLEIIGLQAHQKKLELLLNLDERLPQFVWTDGTRLRQVLLNLLSNAVKFTEAGEVELSVQRKEASNANSLQLYFEVRDTGMGISMDKQTQIFEAFSQADSSISRKHGGTGLGLSISQRLLQLMGGELKLYSQLKRGSRFYFNLTLPPDGFKERHAGEQAYQKAILLEPNARSRQLLTAMLQAEGLDVTAFERATTLRDFLERQPATDAFFINYQLPESDGLELAQNLREQASAAGRSPAIFLMHYALDQEVLGRVQLEDWGIKKLLKPLHPWRLNAALCGPGEGFTTLSTASKASSISGEALSVLVVEDNSINALLVQKLLEELLPNALVRQAKNGKEALAHCKECLPDLIFMDIHMPVLDGLEASRRIRKQFGKGPLIIALTAEIQRDLDTVVAEAGMNAYLSKPFNRAQLTEVLQQQLDKALTQGEGR